jgi:HIRAN domain
MTDLVSKLEDDNLRRVAMAVVHGPKYRTIRSKVAGVTFGDRQQVIGRRCRSGMKLMPVWEMANPYDPNAIALFVSEGAGDWQAVGYLKKELAADLVHHLKAEGLLDVEVIEVTGGGKLDLGLNISVTIIPIEEPQ